MVTIRTVQNIKLGSRITFINGIYAIMIGIFYLIFSNLILKLNFDAVGGTWGFFERYNTDISMIFSRLFILVGVIIITVGASIMYLSYIISRKKEKDFWIVLFIIGGMFWHALFIVEVLNRNALTIIISLIGLVSFVIGMLIPIRYYIDKPYDSY